MAKINLLPWREELRKQQLQEFAVVLGMVVFAAIVASFGWKMERERAVEAQKARNSYIEAQISELEESIKEIEELQRRKNALVERMNVIQGLQGNRPTIVHVFDQFVETLPDGVYYTTIKQEGEKYSIVGIAESNNRVSNLMRSLDSSPWFMNPQLIKVVAKGTAFEFSLLLDLEKPATEGAPGDGSQPNNKT
jgi:type IV pilus assembly protein PilN